MEFDQVVTRRRMTRNFADLPISADKLERIVDNARRGPSAGFTQGQDFVVVTDTDMRKSIAEICGEQDYVEIGFSPFISRAPVLIIPCTSEAAYHRRYQESDKVQDDGTEMDNLGVTYLIIATRPAAASTREITPRLRAIFASFGKPQAT